MKKPDVELFEVPEVIDFANQFKVTNVVAGRGHDCGGLICDLKIGNKKLLEYHDDGWGGEPEIRFLSPEAETLLKNKLTAFNFGQKMFDHGWKFMDSADKIGFYLQLESLISVLVHLKDRAALLKKCERAFIFGTKFQHSIVSWKGKKLADMPQFILQKTYDKYKGELKDGEKFFNTEKQLKALGINP